MDGFNVFVITLIVVILALIIFGFAGGCSRNVDLVKEHASAAFAQAGFTIVGYEGYQQSPISGGYVWYTLRKTTGDTTITYEAALQWWFGEYHIYNLKAIDAIKP